MSEPRIEGRSRDSWMNEDGSLHLDAHPWDFGVATWADYSWRGLADWAMRMGDGQRSPASQVFTRIAEAVERKSAAVTSDASLSAGTTQPDDGDTDVA